MRKPRLELLRFRISSAPLKSAIGIVAIVALFGTSVQAADLPEAPSSAPIPNVAEVPPAVSIPNWTGPYIGLDLGLRYDAVDANVTSATVGTPPTAIALPPAKTGSGSFLYTAAPPNMAYVDNIALRCGRNDETGVRARWSQLGDEAQMKGPTLRIEKQCSHGVGGLRHCGAIAQPPQPCWCISISALK
jgi:hypothetical protein